MTEGQSPGLSAVKRDPLKRAGVGVDTEISLEDNLDGGVKELGLCPLFVAS